MTIDLTADRGKTLQRLAALLGDEKRRQRLDDLDAWYRGEPPLPGVPAGAAAAVREFHEHSSTNYALLICEAVRERQRVRGLRTSADDDVTGDGAAFALWTRMRMPVVSADVHRLKARFGVAYAMVSPPEPDEPGVPVVTAEDPRSCIADLDPKRPWVPRSGLKMLHDPVSGLSQAYLLAPGRVEVAQADKPSKAMTRFSARSWSWNEDLSRDLPAGLMPLVPFENLDGLGEFEPHLRLLRRINFMILQQLTIAVMQAFKQRVLKGLPVEDKHGVRIDYSQMFPADPASVWLIPAAAEIWESGQVDLTGIGVAIRDYTRQLSATSRTPMYMFDSGGENQSAEGAATAREGTVFKVEDRNARDGIGWARVMETAGRWVDAPLADVQAIWAPPQHSSAGERASAMAQANAAGMPLRSNAVLFGELDGAEVDRVMADRADEQLQDQIAQQAALDQQAAATARAQAAQPPATAGPAVPDRTATPDQPRNGAQAPAGAPNAAPAPTGTPTAPRGSQGRRQRDNRGAA